MGEHQPPDFSIRAAGIRDRETLVTFNEALAWETEGRRLDRSRLRAGVESVLADASLGRYVVAERRPSGQVIGQLLITFEWSDWRNGVFWWLQSVYVDKAWRRQRVYGRLYAHVIRDAQQSGNAAGIRLYVEQDNAVAQTVYGRLGLSPTPYRIFEKDFPS